MSRRFKGISDGGNVCPQVSAGTPRDWPPWSLWSLVTASDPFCFPCSFNCRAAQDAHVWFCSLLSSLKPILYSLRISSDFLEWLQMSICSPPARSCGRAHFPCNHQSPALLVTWEAGRTGYISQGPPWTSCLLLVSLSLGLKASYSNLKRLLAIRQSKTHLEMKSLAFLLNAIITSYWSDSFLADIYSKDYWVSMLFSVAFVWMALPLWGLTRTNVTFIPGLYVRFTADSLPFPVLHPGEKQTSHEHPAHPHLLWITLDPRGKSRVDRIPVGHL